MKKRLFLLIFIFYFLISVTNVYALEKCEESEKHKAYRALSQEKKKTAIEPEYCEVPTYERSKRALSLPSSYNSKNLGYISEAKNQQGNGTCWAFSAMTTVKANAKKNGMQFYDFSEAHLIYGTVSGGYSDNTGKLHKFNNGNNLDGGQLQFAATYFFNNEGMLLESEYPYPSTYQAITSSQYPKGRDYLTVKTWNKYFNSTSSYIACGSNDITTIKQAIMENGAAQAAMYFDNSNFKSGFNNREYYLAKYRSIDDTPNHAVTIIGWDDNISKSNFNGATRDGAWIIQNSYGATWSNDGLFYVSYDDQLICSDVAFYSGVTSTKFDKTYKTSDLIGIDTYVANNLDQSVYVASRINMNSTNGEVVKRVSFPVYINQEYKVYLSKSTDLNNKTNWNLLGSGSSSLIGVDSIDLNKEIVVNSDFYIIVEYLANSNKKAFFTVSCKDKTNPSDIYYYSQYKASQNYLNIENAWTDLYDNFIDDNNVECGANTWVYTNPKTIEPTGIILDKDEIYLNIGSTEKVTATVIPNDATNKTVTWISSEPSIASVDQNGNITGLNEGTATITATTSNGISTAVIVHVKKPHITGIEFENGNLTKYITDEPFTVVAHVITDDNSTYVINYASSNTSVATINSDGLITIKGPGTTIISATVSGFKAEFLLTVISPITDITIDQTEVTIGLRETVIKTVTYIPANTNDDKTLTWTSSNPDVASVDSNGLVTGLSVGKTTITARTKNGKEASYVVNVIKRPIKISYATHVQKIGWQDYVSNGDIAGTTDKGYRLEAIKIKIENQDYDGNIEYRTHIQTFGWESAFKKNNQESGTTGLAKRLEAIEIKLTGEMATHYDVYYQVYAQKLGWLGWARNGESSGTAGYAYRFEAIKIKLVNKGEVVEDYGKADAFKDYNDELPPKTPGPKPQTTTSKDDQYISYTTHVQKIGWQPYVLGGQMAGTEGKAYRLEGIKIKLQNAPYTGNIEYRTHIQSFGWESSFKKNNQMSGTEGLAKRLEAIEIRLTGVMAMNYDIYYCVHAQKLGWLGWAKNGERAGTAGFAYRLEGIIIKLVPKGEEFPLASKKPKPFYEN